MKLHTLIAYNPDILRDVNAETMERGRKQKKERSTFARAPDFKQSSQVKQLSNNTLSTLSKQFPCSVTYDFDHSICIFCDIIWPY